MLSRFGLPSGPTSLRTCAKKCALRRQRFISNFLKLLLNAFARSLSVVAVAVVNIFFNWAVVTFASQRGQGPGHGCFADFTRRPPPLCGDLDRRLRLLLVRLLPLGLFLRPRLLLCAAIYFGPFPVPEALPFAAGPAPAATHLPLLLRRRLHDATLNAFFVF